MTQECKDKKKVVHVYKTSYDSVGQPPGFGDFILGSISLHHLALELDFELYLDFRHHPLYSSIQCTLPSCLANIKEKDMYVREFFNTNRDNLFSCFRNGSWEQDSDGSIATYVSCHTFPVSENSTATKQFLQDSLKPNSYTESQLVTILNDLGISNQKYNVLHIRCGDDSQVKIKDLPSRVQKFLDEKMNENVHPCVVITDNLELKTQLSSTYGFLMTPWKPFHMGSIQSFPIGDSSEKENNQETLENDIRNTFLDFLLASRSQHIYAYSCYCLGDYGASSFVRNCETIYGVGFTLI
jgi:hypothetical protein